MGSLPAMEFNTNTAMDVAWIGFFFFIRNKTQTAVINIVSFRIFI